MSEKTTKEDKQELNVYQKLQRVRTEIQSLQIKKSGKNAYAGFTYFELKDFIPPMNDLFLKYGLSSNFSIRDGEALLYITNTDKLDEFVLFESPIAEAQLKGCTPIQALGAVHTYMKRYLYLNALELTEDDLLDKEAGHFKPENKPEVKPMTVQKLNTLRTTLFQKLKENNLTKDEMNAFCNFIGIDGKNENSIKEFLDKGDITSYINEFRNVEVENAG